MTQASDPHRFTLQSPTILLNGQADIYMDTALESLSLSESEGGLAALEVTLRAAGLAQGDGVKLVSEEEYADTITLGKSLKVSFGPINEQETLFEGVISGVELILAAGDPPKLVLLAEDPLQKARMARRSKFHAVGTLASLIQAVAQQSGLTANCAGLSTEIGAEFQANESDLAFLRRICAKYGADFKIDGSQLRAFAKSDHTDADVILTYNQTVSELRFLADLADQVTNVTMKGWDHEASRAYSVTSNAGVLGPGTGTGGTALLQDAFNARAEHVAEQPVHSQTQAQAIVDALYHARARRFVSVEGRCDPGVANLRVGKVAEILDAGERFSNKYYITDATHRFSKDGTGYVTEFRGISAVWKPGVAQ
ncbi:MAG: phage late control D family protein [Mangrovicoccus sp.]